MLEKQSRKRKREVTFQRVRKIQLQEANDEEDRSIKRFEKLLKLNKKKKKVSNLFRNDGLDYILNVVDKNNDNSLNFENVDDDAIKSSSPYAKKYLQRSQPLFSKKSRTLEELMKEKEQKISDQTSLDYASEGENGTFPANDIVFENDDDEDRTENSDEDIGENIKPEKQTKPKIWEDIYGRLRDELGNVIKNNTAESELYIPPNRRNKSIIIDEKKQEQYCKIKKQLKGGLNRLSESNLQNICHQIEEMYMKYSRNDMNENLFNLIAESFSPILTPPCIILDQAMLISLLHANVGSEVGAFFLQRIVEHLNVLFKSENYGDGKESNNILTFLSHLYNFKVTHSTLVFDVFEILMESFKSKDIELIQQFLKNIGFVLRKDNPLKLKELILSIQAKATTFNAEQNDSRVKFMLDTLTAIKNNNIYKIPDYDPSIIEHSKKLLKGFICKGSSIQELAISYNHLLNVETTGRWWIVGSAWIEGDHKESKNLKEEKEFSSPKVAVSKKLLKLAKKLHMNTEVRMSIFCIIMTAQDFMDAFQKLLKLNLKNNQQQEIIHVTLCCALHEKKFNPYYACLAGKFCKFDREYQWYVKKSTWNEFKKLSEMKCHQVKNFASFLSHMIISRNLSILVLKTLQFTEMNEIQEKLLSQILLPILLHESKEVCINVFKHVSPNLKNFKDSLRYFMHIFLLGNQSELSNSDSSKLKDRVKLVEEIFKSSKNVFKL